MTVQSERPQETRLKRLGIKIVTSFWDEHGIRRRASDRSVHDDIVNGIIMDKQYYTGGKKVHTEGIFNPLMQYSYVVPKTEGFICPNCGSNVSGDTETDGCPFCGASYNIEYGSRQSAEKRFAEKKAKDPYKYVLPFILIMGVSIAAGLLIIGATGRTFGLFDILKGTVIGVVAGFLIFLAVYLTRVNAITAKDEAAYERQKAMILRFESELAKHDLTLNAFCNNFFSELSARFFDEKISENRNIIDWDIMEYEDYGIDKNQTGYSVKVTAELRVLQLKGSRIHSEKRRIRATLKPNPMSGDSLRPGVNIIRCHNCGSPIDVEKAACEYCGTPIRYKQKLYLTELISL